MGGKSTAAKEQTVSKMKTGAWYAFLLFGIKREHHKDQATSGVWLLHTCKKKRKTKQYVSGSFCDQFSDTETYHIRALPEE